MHSTFYIFYLRQQSANRQLELECGVKSLVLLEPKEQAVQTHNAQHNNGTLRPHSALQVRGPDKAPSPEQF